MQWQVFVYALLLPWLLAAQGEATISGRVVHASMGTPIAGAKIVVDLGVAHAESDEEGNFKLERLRPGTHTFHAVKDGFAVDRLPNILSLHLAPGSAVQGVVLKLKPEAKISGVVKDPSGSPIDATVRLVGADSQTFFGVQHAKSGEYAFVGLPAGNYRVFAQGIKASVQYALTYFPSEVDAIKAGELRINSGEERKGADIMLREMVWVQVSGKFRGSCPAGYRCVALYSEAGRRTTGMMRSGPLEANGDFALQVPPGNLKIIISAFPAGGGQQPMTIGFQDLRVLAEDAKQGIQGIVVPASQIHRVQARYEWVTPNAASLPLAQVMLNPLDGFSIAQYAKPGAEGLLVADKVAAGHYAVIPMGIPAGMYVAKIITGDMDITQNGLDISTSTPALVRVLLSNGGASLEGRVAGDEFAGTQGCMVILSPDTPHQQLRQLHMRSTNCDAKGAYAIRDIAPGPYQVRVRVGEKVTAPTAVRFSAGARTTLDLLRP